jgi:hypothetical protein
MLAIPSVHALDIRFQKGSYQSGNGGEFVALTDPSFLEAYDASTIQWNSAGTLQGFSTFCMERLEKMSFKVDYQGSLNDRAIQGGPDFNEDPNLSGDPLSIGVAWLYNAFALGNLSGYEYSDTAARKSSASLLQRAIWMLEDEMSMDASNIYVDMAINKFGSLSLAQASNSGAFPVQIINLYQNIGDRTYRRQDVLVRIADAKVPDQGMTVGLLGIGMIGLVALRRRSVD